MGECIVLSRVRNGVLDRWLSVVLYKVGDPVSVITEI